MLQDRLRRSEQAVTKEKEQRSASLLSVGADLFGVVFGRKSATTAIGSATRTYKEHIGHRPGRRERYTAVKQQLDDLQAQIESEASEIQTQMDASTARARDDRRQAEEDEHQRADVHTGVGSVCKGQLGRTQAGMGLSHLATRVASAFCPRPHSSCTAWTAFSRPERATTITIVKLT